MFVAARSSRQRVAADEATIRVATYNTSLFRDTDGQLVRDLEGGNNEQARKIAEVIQRVRPDILLVNEFDYDDAGRAAELFRTKYLAVGQNGCEPIKFDHYFTGPVNTGVPSGRDLNHNGKLGDPDDAIGFGRHEGQYGMLVLSKFPIDREHVRSFQKFLWRDMPEADAARSIRRRTSRFTTTTISPSCGSRRKAFGTCRSKCRPAADGRAVHAAPAVLASRRRPSSTAPRTATAAAITTKSASSPITSIATKGELPGRRRGQARRPRRRRTVRDRRRSQLRSGRRRKHARHDGPAARAPARQRIVHAHERRRPAHGARSFPINSSNNHGDPAHVTSNFTQEGHGCLRIDYALPSRGLEVVKGGIFWPAPGEPGADAITATDHRSVWIDVTSEVAITLD